jgi:hypothetical protein
MVRSIKDPHMIIVPIVYDPIKQSLTRGPASAHTPWKNRPPNSIIYIAAFWFISARDLIPQDSAIHTIYRGGWHLGYICTPSQQKRNTIDEHYGLAVSSKTQAKKFGNVYVVPGTQWFDTRFRTPFGTKAPIYIAPKKSFDKRIFDEPAVRSYQFCLENKADSLYKIKGDHEGMLVF